MNLILDGFGHYGTGATGRTNMLNGAYAQMDAAVQPQADNPRTGTIALRSTSTVGNPAWRRVLPNERTKLFVGMAHYLTNLPSNSQRYAFAQYRTSGNAAIVTFGLTTTGQVTIINGGMSGTVEATGSPVFTAGNYQFVECFADINGAASSAEVRVNGVTVVSASGINLGSTAIGQVSAGAHSVNTHGIGNYYHADLRVGDDLGGVNDDFLGDRRVYTLFPVADGTPNEWTPSSGVDSYAMIDETAPDDDTTYITSPAEGSITRVRFEPVPDAVAAIGGIAFHTYMKKTDAGEALFANNVVSGGVTGLGEVIAPAANYRYEFVQNFDNNPDGDVPWTPEAVDAMFSELEHVGGSG